jgi:gliding motility-associated protein GldM
MAHERLSPRQKMIGMMYLVLTAMLALNVSKEAVEAFKKVDQGLTKTIENYAAKNSEIYSAFDKAAAQNPAKAGPAKDKAYMVKQRADELFDYIQDRKIEIITTAEGPETKAIEGKEVIIEEVKKIDENNVPSEIMVGANQNGKANDLKALINSFRDDMIDVIGGKNVSVEESLKSIFNTEDGLDKSGEKERWETLTFQSLPLVAVITILSKMQVDVRNAETDVLNFLYEQIDARSFKFNKIFPTIVTKSSDYVMQGNDYEAQVFISATDTTQSPEIFIGDVKTTVGADGTPKYEIAGGGTPLPLDETGKGIYKVRASSIGPKPWGGLITLKAPDGTKVSYKFDSRYTVGVPNVVISPTAMNVLYYGIDNPLDISVPGIGSDKVKVTMTNGTIAKGKAKNSKGEDFPGEYVANPKTIGQDAQIVVTADVNGRQMSFPPRNFRIRPVPDPIAKFGGKSTGSIDKNVASAVPALQAELENFDFDLKYNVTEFTITINDKGFDYEKTSTSNRVTPEQLDLIKKLTRGKNLTIVGIKAVGPDKRVRDLPAVVLKIQ